MKYFSLLLLLAASCVQGQSLYKRTWATAIPISDKPVQPFSSKRIVKSTPFVAEVNPNTGNLFVVNPEGNEIFMYNTDNPVSVPFFKIPAEDLSFIEQIKFDSRNNMIITGTTKSTGLATKDAYSHEKLENKYSGDWFIAKINKNGSLVWATYFHEMPQNTAHLAIDKDNNIYVLNKRIKSDVLPSPAFQPTGDPASVLQKQDVISKFSAGGKHLWSTFYANDQSKLLALEAGKNGLFVYGIHLTLTTSAGYFGTPGTFQETIKGNERNTSAVFLSKFGFDGKRQWSTYFGLKTYAPLAPFYISKNSSPLAVVGDDAYILAAHQSDLFTNLATQDVYSNASGTSRTVTAFSGKGARKWTTYVETGDMIEKSADGKQLFITATTVDFFKNDPFVKTTRNAYQPDGGGTSDILTYTLSTDGKQVKYATWYGFKGYDTGITLPAPKGYYTIGFSQYNSKPDTPFATDNAPLNKFTYIHDNDYMGNFIGYFTLQRAAE